VVVTYLVCNIDAQISEAQMDSDDGPDLVARSLLDAVRKIERLKGLRSEETSKSKRGKEREKGKAESGGTYRNCRIQVSNGIIGIPDSLCIETQKEIDRTTGAHFFKNVFVYVIELA
jgi:hypothetical protein